MDVVHLAFLGLTESATKARRPRKDANLLEQTVPRRALTDAQTRTRQLANELQRVLIRVGLPSLRREGEEGARRGG